MPKKNKNDRLSCINKNFFDFVETHINDFAEIDSYLSQSKLSQTDMDEKHPHYNNQKVLYIPLNSIKSIKIL